jgi:hypothetical protein
MAPTIDDLVALAKAAAAEAADYQERFGAQDVEARKIVDVIESFLRVKGRVVYGGAAINAHLPADKQFYDPSLYLPDYDFMTPDPLQDCADLIAAFQDEGLADVEAKFGIHEGTYKIFVNYRAAADITYMPPEIYERVVHDADTIGGIRYASANFLRMNIYLELSRPAGDVSRWEKVYKRLLLLNEAIPLKAGRCVADPIEALSGSPKQDSTLHDRIVGIGMAANAIFLSGISYLQDAPPRPDEVVLMIAEKPAALVAELQAAAGLRATAVPAMGELLPARTELRTARRQLVAVVFESVACHAYTTLDVPVEYMPVGYRLASLDLLIQMYYAFYFADLEGYVPVRLLCLVQELIEIELTRRRKAAGAPTTQPRTVFPLECAGHQPSLPELKKAHRERVQEKRKELVGALRRKDSGVRMTRKRRH